MSKHFDVVKSSSMGKLKVKLYSGYFKKENASKNPTERWSKFQLSYTLNLHVVTSTIEVLTDFTCRHHEMMEQGKTSVVYLR